VTFEYESINFSNDTCSFTRQIRQCLLLLTLRSCQSCLKLITLLTTSSRHRRQLGCV